jgi:hypothetical protein
MMTQHQFVLTLCGPHMHDDHPSPIYMRHTAGAHQARYRNAKLLIAGDARSGLDVEHFVVHARAQVPDLTVIGCYDAGGCTLSDVQAALRQIDHLVEPGGSAHVLLISDAEHILRAGIMLRGEIRASLTRGQTLTVETFGIHGTPRPYTDAQLAREEQGLRDYLDGLYLPRSCGDYGKPEAANVPSNGEQHSPPPMAL